MLCMEQTQCHIGEENVVREPVTSYVDQGVLPFGAWEMQQNMGRIDSVPTSSKETPVIFRHLSKRIPSTTFGTFGLYRYPAKFIPQVVSYIFDCYGQPGETVIDPFAGSGTTGLVARLYGISYELWDLNPLLKVLHDAAIMAPVPVRIDKLVEEMGHCPQRFLPLWSNLGYWFPESVIEVLSQLFGYYHVQSSSSIKSLIVVPLLKVMRKFSYNDHQRQKLSRSPIAIRRVESLMEGDWQTRLFDMLEEEIRLVQRKRSEYESLLQQSRFPVTCRVLAGIDGIAQSARIEGEWDMLITSPPYLQAQEYIRCSKLDLFWLGFSEEAIRQLARLELPYRDVPPIVICSETYHKFRSNIQEPHLHKMFDRYFHGVLTILTNLSHHIRKRMFLFVGPASVRGVSVPIDRILVEHFSALGWTHEATLIDSIVARVMFRSEKNPATGLVDRRMATEHLVILKRKWNT